MPDQQQHPPFAELAWAETEEEKCWRDECWLVNGHDGLHRYLPALTGDTRKPPGKEKS